MKLAQWTHKFNPPCHRCKDRILGCHSTCESYKEYRAKIEEVKNKKMDQHDIIIDYHRDKRMRKNGV